MAKKECLAMLLAGGQGSRLKALTKNIAKPAVAFGGKFRIIDFALSNCANSHIDTVGVLTQYRPYVLHNYIGTGAAWNLDSQGGGVSILPPYATEAGGAWYAGTADAIYQNLDYILDNDPEYVLILSGDHLYSMDYAKMLSQHIKHKADLTVSVMPVEWSEASRFGIITKDENDAIVKFSEKPKNPDSNLASMGIYIFSTSALVSALRADAKDKDSSHDFGNDIIPKMLARKKRLFVYEFNGFWRDVGTIESYYETNMALLGAHPEFNIYDDAQPIMSNAATTPSQLIGEKAKIEDAIVANGVRIYGEVRHSIISTAAYVAARAKVEDSLLLPNSCVWEGSVVQNTILGERSVINPGLVVGDPKGETTVIGNDVIVDSAYLKKLVEDGKAPKPKKPLPVAKQIPVAKATLSSAKKSAAKTIRTTAKKGGGRK